MNTIREFADSLVRERRAVLVRVAGEERLIAAEDAGRYRDALGAMPPSGLPDGVPRERRRAAALAGRALRPLARAVHDRRGERALRPRRRAASCGRSSGRRSSSAASCVPAAPSASGATPTCSAASGARRSRRCAGRSSPSSRRRSAASCRAGTGSTGGRRCARRSSRCRRSSLPVSLWETEVLPRRVPGYRPELLDQLCATGEVVWVGAGLDRVALFFREDAAVLGASAGAPAPEGEAHDADPRGAALERGVLVRPARRRPGSRPRPRCRRSGISSGRAR